MADSEIDGAIGVIKVERSFDGSRLAEEILAGAYEIVLPMSMKRAACSSRPVRVGMGWRRRQELRPRFVTGVRPW